MAAIKEVKMQDEPWYREIAAELRHYKKYKARIGVLETRMIRQMGSANTILTSYDGINAGVSTEEDNDETELELLRIKVTSIEFALGALTEIERRIIELKFLERHKNVIIYDMDLPMAPNTFYKELGGAMETIKEILSEKKMKRN